MGHLCFQEEWILSLSWPIRRSENMTSPKSSVTLQEINADTVRDVCNLTVRDDQQKVVAPNAVLQAQTTE
jgi:hypothetical protein